MRARADALNLQSRGHRERGGPRPGPTTPFSRAHQVSDASPMCVPIRLGQESARSTQVKSRLKLHFLTHLHDLRLLKKTRVEP